MGEVTRRTALQGGLGAGAAIALPSTLRGTLGFGAASTNSGDRAVVGRWVGAVTRTRVTVALRTVNAAAARLHVFSDPDLRDHVADSEREPTGGDGFVKLVVDGLSSGTQYYYSVGLEGVRSGRIGSFRTGPAGAADFTFGFASCCAQPDSTTFSAIRSHDPDFFLHIGDLHYGDIARNDVDAFRAEYATALAATHQGPFYANVPTLYTWSDHDFGGNNSNGTSGSRPAARAAYHQCVPSHQLPSPTGGIYQTFRYGRVRFISTDNRSFKSPRTAVDDGEKTVLGAEQKRWFKHTIRDATEPVIIWINEIPWISPEVEHSDRWGGYKTERDELARFIAGSGKNVAIVSGDLHALAADDGTHSAGGIPIFQAAPLDQRSSIRAGRYTHGPFPPSEGIQVQQYGLMRVRDKGSEIKLHFTGYRVGEGALLTYTHTFAV